jgi:hypothetical protein
MNRSLLVFAALPLLAAPVSAQPLSADAYLKQSQAIAIRVQRQLIACWQVPPGAEGQHIALDVGFFGNGQLDGLPSIAAESIKPASKDQALAESVLQAVADCEPFTGLEELGAGMMERFSVTVHFQS